jgi:hypothetical protein
VSAENNIPLQLGHWTIHGRAVLDLVKSIDIAELAVGVLCAVEVVDASDFIQIVNHSIMSAFVSCCSGSSL